MKRVNKILRFGILFTLMIGLTHCESEFPWKTKSKAISSLVVDAIITNEMKAQCINACITNENMNFPTEPVSGLAITVTDSLHTYVFTESQAIAGSYYSTPFQAVVGKTYILTISYNSKVYIAKANMVPITPLDTFNLIKTNNSVFYTYAPVWSGEPGMLEVYMDWSAVPLYCSIYGHCQAQETFYNLNDFDINKIFGPDLENISFPPGTKLVRTKYSLSAEHQNFLRSLLMETEWRGGLFDVQPGNVKSNLSNGALGFFGACMVLKDSLIVK